MDYFISGGISGAITDPYSGRALKHAKLYYDTIRNARDDIVKIARNTGFTEAQIRYVKNYLFLDKHNLADGFRRFDPSFKIAESWRRLAYDPENIQSHDLTLIKHELSELELVLKGVTQEQAHEIVSRHYDYPRESETFYRNLRGVKENAKNG